MGKEKLTGPELKKMVKLSKKKPLAFAFNPGKKKEEHVVMIDRRLSASILGKAAKAEGTSPKVAFGQMETEGKLVTLTCERIVPRLAKTLKMYFKTQRITVNVQVLDADGNALESDIEDLPDDPEFDADDVDEQGPEEDTDTDAAEATDQGDDETKWLAARLKTAQPGVAAAQGEMGEKLRKALAAAVSQLKSGDLNTANRTINAIESALDQLEQEASVPEAPETAPDPEPDTEPAPETKPDPQPDARALAARAGELKTAIGAVQGPAAEKLSAALVAGVKALKGGKLETAEATFGKIEAALAKLGASAPSAPETVSPEAQKWAVAESRLQPLVDKAMAEKRGDLDAINRAFNYAKELAASGDHARALAAAGKVAELLKAAQSATTTAAASEAADAAPDNVVAYTQSRLAWIKTRGDLRGEIQSLKSAIDTATAGVDGLEDVPSKSGGLFDYLDDIDTALEDTLEKLVETPDGESREQLKATAKQIISKYETTLDTPFFQAVDNNGFVKTNIRGAAMASLGAVSTALNA